MKRSIIAAFAAMFISSTAVAAGISSTGTVIAVEPVYRNTVPIYERQCYVTREQVHASNSGDVFAGMIIGGIIGKGLTGRDNGAAVGAVIGGLAAADRPRGVYYQNVEHCENVLVGHERTIIHYLVTYRYQGVTYQETTYRSFVVGQQIYVDP